MGFDLAKLEARFGKRLITEITRDDADNFLRSYNDLTDVTRRHIRIISHGLYNFAIDRGYTTLENPFAQRKHRRKYHEDERLPECMNWRDVRKVMATAAEHDRSMVPPLAIGFFAGLRTSEITALDWKHVDLVAKRITVSPEVAKKRRARYVTIEDGLFGWLLPYQKDSGPVAPEGQAWRYRLDDVRKIAGVKWPKNAMRHSFASHHYVLTSDAAKTAFELGHAGRDAQMLFEHYRSLVTAEDARAYFDIRPSAKDNLIELKKAN
jgi:integrase